MALSTRSEEWIISLAEPELTLDLVGGKGASLANLAAAGFPIARGFQITTDAYRHFVAVNDLQPVVDTLLSHIDVNNLDSLERAAETIHQAFLQSNMPKAITAALERDYAALGTPDLPVAVRSSATAEDLPELSFAGQQETFLNVRGVAPLAQAVLGCWSSL